MPISAPARSRDHNDIGVDLDIDLSAIEAIPEVQKLYMNRDANGTVSVLVVVPEKDFSIERVIYSKQTEILDKSPEIKVSLRVVSLRGRRLSEVISPLSTPVYSRS